MYYRLVQHDPETGYEELSRNDSVWECVKDWEILHLGDIAGDYRVEDEDYNEVWRNVKGTQEGEA